MLSIFDDIASIYSAFIFIFSYQLNLLRIQIYSEWMNQESPNELIYAHRLLFSFHREMGHYESLYKMVRHLQITNPINTRTNLTFTNPNPTEALKNPRSIHSLRIGMNSLENPGILGIIFTNPRIQILRICTKLRQIRCFTNPCAIQI